MTYAEVEPKAWPVLWLLVVISVFGFYFVAIIGKRWRDRRALAAKFLFLAFSCVLIAILLFLAGLIEMFVTGYKMEVYRFSLGAAYAAVCVANVFLILFGAEIFDIPSRYLWKYILIQLVIAVAVILPDNYYGVPDSDPRIWGPTIRIYTSIAVVVFSIIIYSRILSQALYTARRTSESVARGAFRLIAGSIVCLILFFLFETLDTLEITLYPTQGGYTIFNYLGFVSALVFMVLASLSFIMPDWLRRRLSGSAVERVEGTAK